MTKRFDCLVSEEVKGKRYFTNIGVAFANNDGSISVKLRALPKDGDIWLKEPEPREAREARQRSQENNDKPRQKSFPRRVTAPAFPKEQEADNDFGGDDDGDF